VNNTLLWVVDGKPIDVCGLSRARPGTDIGEAIGAQLGRLETARKQPSHHIVGEEFHTAVRVVDDEPLAGAEELVRNDQRTNRIITCSSARISNDMCVTFGQPGGSRGIQSRVHTGQDRELPCRRERKLSLRANRCCVPGVGSKYVISCSHRRLSSGQGNNRVSTISTSAVGIGNVSDRAANACSSPIRTRKTPNLSACSQSRTTYDRVERIVPIPRRAAPRALTKVPEFVDVLVGLGAPTGSSGSTGNDSTGETAR